MAVFAEAFSTLGYETCLNGRLEKDFEKVVFYAKPASTPTHAARQLPNGRWTSKLGNEEDIEHDLAGLEGTLYGHAKLFMRRRKA